MRAASCGGCLINHLDDLGRGVVVIVVCLVVLVPLVASVHSVEVLGLPRPVLVVPPVHLQQKQDNRWDSE